jgi:hypothetical protein
MVEFEHINDFAETRRTHANVDLGAAFFAEAMGSVLFIASSLDHHDGALVSINAPAPARAPGGNVPQRTDMPLQTR